MADEHRKGGLVVPDQPQISVELVHNTEIEITVARISDSFDSVDVDKVIIPVECGKVVAKAILDLLKTR